MRYQDIKSEWSFETFIRNLLDLLEPHEEPSSLSKLNDRILLKERLRRVFQFYPDPEFSSSLPASS